MVDKNLLGQLRGNMLHVVSQVWICWVVASVMVLFYQMYLVIKLHPFHQGATLAKFAAFSVTRCVFSYQDVLIVTVAAATNSYLPSLIWMPIPGNTNYQPQLFGQQCVALSIYYPYTRLYCIQQNHEKP